MTQLYMYASNRLVTILLLIEPSKRDELVFIFLQLLDMQAPKMFFLLS